MNNKRQLSIEEVKNIQLDILKKVHNYCILNSINYSLAYGTLLGAVRHKGYIPWDDDIDIMMPRRDYDCLAKGIGQVHNDLWVQSVETDESYFYEHSKIVKKGTRYTKYGHSSGVSIDIFIWEELPIYITDRKEYFKRLQKVNSLIWKTSKTYIYTGKKKHIERIKYSIKRFIYPSRSEVIKEYKSILHSVKDADLFYYWWQKPDGKLMLLTTEDFANTILLPFEGNSFSCISNYDFFLKQRYGDYQKLPPVEERVLTHDITYFLE